MPDRRFIVRYPNVQMDVHFSDDLVDLIGDGYDAAVRVSMRTRRDSSLIALKLGSAKFRLYAAPAYLARKGPVRSREDLVHHELIVHEGLPRLIPNLPGGDVILAFCAMACRS